MGHNPFGTFLSPKLFTLQFATVEKISYEIATNIVGVHNHIKNYI